MTHRRLGPTKKDDGCSLWSYLTKFLISCAGFGIKRLEKRCATNIILVMTYENQFKKSYDRFPKKCRFFYSSFFRKLQVLTPLRAFLPLGVIAILKLGGASDIFRYSHAPSDSSIKS